MKKLAPKLLRCEYCSCCLSRGPVFRLPTGGSACKKCSSVRTGLCRHFAYEAAVKNDIFSCMYAEKGCTETFCLDDKGHEDRCKYRPLICPLDDVFKGDINELKMHFKQEHKQLFVNKLRFNSSRYAPETDWKALFEVEDRMFLITFSMKNYEGTSEFGVKTNRRCQYKVSVTEIAFSGCKAECRIKFTCGSDLFLVRYIPVSYLTVGTNHLHFDDLNHLFQMTCSFEYFFSVTIKLFPKMYKCTWPTCNFEVKQLEIFKKHERQCNKRVYKCFGHVDINTEFPNIASTVFDKVKKYFASRGICACTYQGNLEKLREHLITEHFYKIWTEKFNFSVTLSPQFIIVFFDTEPFLCSITYSSNSKCVQCRVIYCKTFSDDYSVHCFSNKCPTYCRRDTDNFVENSYVFQPCSVGDVVSVSISTNDFNKLVEN